MNQVFINYGLKDFTKNRGERDWTTIGWSRRTTIFRYSFYASGHPFVQSQQDLQITEKAKERGKATNAANDTIRIVGNPSGPAVDLLSKLLNTLYMSEGSQLIE